MPFSGWTQQSLNWYMDASDYTGFHRRLAQIILPWVRRAETLLDLGCGPGCIDLELAEHVGRIAAIDIDSMAVDMLIAQCAKRGVSNIDAICADAERANMRADVVLISLFAPKDMQQVFQSAGRCVIRIMNGSNKSWLASSGAPKDIPSHIQFARELERLGMRYELQQKELEFGQPLASEQQAADFLRHFDRESSSAEIQQRLQESLLHTGDEFFPYYIPYRKPVCVFLIEGPF